MYVQTAPVGKNANKKKTGVGAKDNKRECILKIKTVDGVCQTNEVLKNLCKSLSKNKKKQVECWKNEATECKECYCVCCSVGPKSKRGPTTPFLGSKSELERTTTSVGTTSVIEPTAPSVMSKSVRGNKVTYRTRKSVLIGTIPPPYS